MEDELWSFLQAYMDETGLTKNGALRVAVSTFKEVKEGNVASSLENAFARLERLGLLDAALKARPNSPDLMFEHAQLQAEMGQTFLPILQRLIEAEFLAITIHARIDPNITFNKVPPFIDLTLAKVEPFQTEAENGKLVIRSWHDMQRVDYKRST